MRVGASFCAFSCAACTGWVASIATAAMRRSERIGCLNRRVLFPVLDFKLRLLAALPVVELKLEVFGPNALLELERRSASIVALVRALAAEEGHELVLAGLQIAQVQAVHAALGKRLDLARRVQIVCDFLLIYLERHSVELEKFSDVHRDEYRHPRIGRKQQLLLEHEEIPVEIDHVLFQSLNVLIEPAGVGGGLSSATGGERGVDSARRMRIWRRRNGTRRRP